jgi:hypothetical protein
MRKIKRKMRKYQVFPVNKSAKMQSLAAGGFASPHPDRGRDRRR